MCLLAADSAALTCCLIDRRTFICKRRKISRNFFASKKSDYKTFINETTKHNPGERARPGVTCSFMNPSDRSSRERTPKNSSLTAADDNADDDDPDAEPPREGAERPEPELVSAGADKETP